MAERRFERHIAGNELGDLRQNASSPEIPSQIVAPSGETVARQLVFSLPVPYDAATGCSSNISDHVHSTAVSVRSGARCDKKPLQLTVQDCWVQAG